MLRYLSILIFCNILSANIIYLDENLLPIISKNKDIPNELKLNIIEHFNGNLEKSVKNSYWNNYDLDLNIFLIKYLTKDNGYSKYVCAYLKTVLEKKDVSIHINIYNELKPSLLLNEIDCEETPP